MAVLNDTIVPFDKVSSQINAGDTAWVLISSALVMLMIPGLGYFYSGMAQHKNALSLLFFSMISLAVVSVQWFLIGFSLSFAPITNPFIGNLKHALFLGMFDANGVWVHPDAPSVPGGAFAVYQGMFAAITPALAFGAAAERARLFPAIVFIFVWTTLVYDFVAYWTWGYQGWLRVLGALDYAGGGPVHIASGAAGLAYALITGKRSGYGKEKFKPHSLSTVFLGTGLLWFGWFGFNGGAGAAANARGALAIVNTSLSAGAGAITWVLWDFKKTKKFSAFGFCSGVISGLVSITPAAGFVQPYYAFIFGIIGALGCNVGIELKNKVGFDDAFDAFGVHGLGGIIGNILTGIFASKNAAIVGGVTIPGGWVDGHFILVPIQLAATVAVFAWSFFFTYLILWIFNQIPHLRVRLNTEDEKMGTDMAQMGEWANGYLEQIVTTTTQNLVSSQILQGGSRNNSGIFHHMISGNESNTGTPKKSAVVNPE